MRLLLKVAALIAAVLIPMGGADAATAPKPKPKVTSMTYGSGTLGPLGSKVLKGNMATAQVGFFGDSITARNATEMVNYLATKGIAAAVDAQGSRNAEVTLDDLEAYATVPDVIVMEAGTNDIFNPIAFAAQVDRAKVLLAGKTLLWVDVQASRNSQPEAVKIADQRNSMLVNRALYSKLPAASIISWSYALGSAPGRLTPAGYLEDGVHQWTSDTATHDNGVAYRRAVIMLVLGPVLGVTP